MLCLEEEVVRLFAARNHQSFIMRVHHSLFCFFFLSLHITNSRTAGPVTRLYGVPGRNISVRCSFPSSGEWKFFCWENCEEKNILIKTQKSSDGSGRYRIESDWKSQYVLVVSISALTQSDSGQYQCGLWTYSSTYSYQDFELVVAEDLLDGNKVPHLRKEAGSSVTVACSFEDSGRRLQFCRGECEEVLVETNQVRAERGRYSSETSGGLLYVSISALTQSDSGRYRCNLDVAFSRNPYRDFNLTVADAVNPSASSPTSFTPAASQLPSSHYVPVIVGVTLAAVVVLFAAALLVSCRRRSLRDSRRRGDDGVKMENVDYENVSSQDATYQSLSPASRDQNQIYSTLSQPR